MFGTTKECYINTINFIKNNYPDALIITGGVQATFDKEEILKSKMADIACLNEGELQIQYIANLLSNLVSNKFKNLENHLKNLPDLPGGICFQTKLDQIEDSGETSQPVDFEWDLSTYYEQINIKSYFKYGGLGAFSKFVEHYSGKASLRNCSYKKRM